MLPTIAREGDVIVMIDQRKLPAQEIYVRCKTAPEVARAIKTMVIRGAPAIGVAAPDRRQSLLGDRAHEAHLRRRRASRRLGRSDQGSPRRGRAGDSRRGR